MQPEEFDVLVVGGGIHGVGVAQAAAAGGYSVLLLEQTALASATSSRSSKLIHGGLRYLEHGQFGLVRQCLRERSLLLELAPDLVQLRPFFIPVYTATGRRPWVLRAGLSLYALLAGFRHGSAFRSLARRDWHELDGLRTEGLEAVLQYWDAQTDDEALTRSVMQSAEELGAQLSVPSEFLSAEIEDKRSLVSYRHDGRVMSCYARVLVNAAGPWVNTVLSRMHPAPSTLAIDLVQGTHIVVDIPVSRGIYYLEAPQDRRGVFVMPWKGQALVGTTETLYEGDPAAAAPRSEEVDYLLTVLGHYFPGHRFETQGVSSAFAGLRVLPASSARPFERPRDTVFHTDRPEYPRILSIYGGKLTSYRATAEVALKRLGSSLPRRRAVASTRRLPLARPRRPV